MMRKTNLPNRSILSLTIITIALIKILPAALAETPNQQATAAKPARPNILLIMTDDHANRALGAYGGPLKDLNPTPNLDKIAQQGIRFDNAFVTNSICGPSRAVILTGKYSHLNGFYTNERGTFNASQQTFPKLMQKAGYQTAMIGKWHLVTDPTGFDHWDILIGQGTYYNPRFKSAEGIKENTGYATDILGDKAINYLEGRDRSKPFCLIWNHKAPHREWTPGPNEYDLYKDKQIPVPDTFFDDYAGRASPASLQTMSIAKDTTATDLKLTPMKNLNSEQLARWHQAYDAENSAYRNGTWSLRDDALWRFQRYMKDYLRCVAGVDRNVGRVMEYLDKHQLTDNTLVIYTSDQGFYLGEHGWFDKRWMYEESLRTPMMMRWPGKIKPASTTDKMVLNLDLPETILDAAGVAIPSDMQGKSLVPIITGQPVNDWRKSIYYRYYEFPGSHSVRQHYGVRTETQKLIYYPDSKEWEFFDLTKDPKEMASLYTVPTYAFAIEKLKVELKRLKAEFKDNDQMTEPPARVNNQATEKASKKAAKKKKAAAKIG